MQAKGTSDDTDEAIVDTGDIVCGVSTMIAQHAATVV